MSVLKRLERIAKATLALIAVAVLWRPARRSRAKRDIGKASRVLLVRIDDRMGEVLLVTPLLGIVRRALPGARVDALIHSKAARILSGHPDVDQVLSFDARKLFLGPLAPGVRALRRAKYDIVVDCTNWTDPSVRSAIICRLIGPRAAVIGPAAPPVAGLYSIAVGARNDARSELEQRAHLLSPLGEVSGALRLSFRCPKPAAGLKPLIEDLRSSPYGVVNPGGRLDWRRVPPDAFAAAAQALLASGFRALVTWGPGEVSLAKAVVQRARGSILAPETDIDGLAALMHSAAVTVCNNTGPMHLSVALGTPTLAFFLKMDPQRWGYGHPPHRMIDLTPALESGEPLDAAVRFEVAKFLDQLRRAPDASLAQSPAQDPRP